MFNLRDSPTTAPVKAISFALPSSMASEAETAPVVKCPPPDCSKLIEPRSATNDVTLAAVPSTLSISIFPAVVVAETSLTDNSSPISSPSPSAATKINSLPVTKPEPLIDPLPLVICTWSTAVVAPPNSMPPDSTPDIMSTSLPSAVVSTLPAAVKSIPPEPSCPAKSTTASSATIPALIVM